MMKRFLSPLLAGMLCLGVMACSEQGSGGATANTASTPSSAAASAPATVGLAISTLNNPFFVALKEGAEAAAQKANINLVTVDAQNDPARQIANVEDMIQKKVQVILINPTDSDAVASVVKQAQAAGIKVISLDRSVNGAEVTSHIASDNRAGGRMAAAFLIEKIGGKGNVVELEGIPGSSAARERGAGFAEGLASHTEVKQVAKQPADFDRAKGMSVMENILQAQKDIAGVFAQNDEMALGAVNALEAAGLKDVVVVGFDATDDAVIAVNAGKMAATVQQRPDLIGRIGVETASKVINGETVEAQIPVELELVKN